MNQNEKRLGQGLDALFENKENDMTTSDINFKWVKPNQLVPNPNQPRRVFNEASLQELAESIRIKGILQPLLVRNTDEPDKWQIIAGERRWRAAKLAGIEALPVLIKDLNDEDTMIAALIENVHRDELNPIERAEGLNAIKLALNISQVELSNFVGMQRSTVANLLRIVTAPDNVKEALIDGVLSIGHAKAILSLPVDVCNDFITRIKETGLSVRGTEIASNYWQKYKKLPWGNHKNAGRRKKNHDIINMSNKLSKNYNCRVYISGNPEKGKISFSFENNEQFQDILKKLGLEDQPE